MTALLEVRDLRLEFKTARGILTALNGISFDVERGEVFGLVGETGCGKTVTGLSVLRLLPRSARIVSGLIQFDGSNLLEMSLVSDGAGARREDRHDLPGSHPPRSTQYLRSNHKSSASSASICIWVINRQLHAPPKCWMQSGCRM